MKDTLNVMKMRNALQVEIDGVSETLARTALSLTAFKLPVKTRFITRREVE
jgi:ribosomal protein L16/L10AE